MRNSLLLIGCLFIFSMTYSSFRFANDLSPNVLTAVQKYFHEQLDAFSVSVNDYQLTFEKVQQGEASWEALQRAHLNCRLAFKRAEFLLEYNDRYAIKKMINGAPLPSVEPNVPEVTVLEPQGLQVLDELLYNETSFDTLAIAEQIDLLVDASKKVVKYQLSIKMQHRKVIEACRLELIRIYTLGLTGFDTPGSLNAIPEAKAALESVAFVIKEYHPLLVQYDLDIIDALNWQLDEAIKYLSLNTDFDTFDRLEYYREYIMPLDYTLWQLHSGLGIETYQEVTSVPQPTTMKNAPLFSDAFFNTTYYRGFADDENLTTKIELGKLLFYDPILSDNNERACASCHQPDKAFSDGLATSIAMDGERHIQRNAPTLLNSIYTERFFYDLREPQLERQIKHVVLDEDEFNTDFLTIINKLAQSETYAASFAKAYPQAGISKYSISNAIASYLAELTSFNSEFDRYARREIDHLDQDVKLGYNLFMGKAACGTCHFAPTFSGLVPPYYQESESEVLGVPMHPDSSKVDSDPGRISSSRPADEVAFYQYSFKTVTVRNTALTAPYMHNGAFPDLNSVMQFYNHGGGAGLNISLEHQTLAPDSLHLTLQETQAIISFMNSLTDVSKVSSPPATLPNFEHQPTWNKRQVGGRF